MDNKDLAFKEKVPLLDKNVIQSFLGKNVSYPKAEKQQFYIIVLDDYPNSECQEFLTLKEKGKFLKLTVTEENNK